MEQWKDVTGYEGLYQVSDAGRVAKIRNGERRVKKASRCSGDYLQACLTKEKKQRRFLVHRLVAEAFIPNPDGKPEVNHIDGDKANNAASNLEWVTARENVGHSYIAGIRKTTIWGEPPTVKEYLNRK